MLKSAHAHDDGTVFYFDEMGNKYAAIGGSLAWRINNPGLVHSHCSRKFGSIGNLGHYAIFPDPQNGRKALSTWIRSKKYFNSSLKVVAKHYQPKNPEGCVQKLSSSCSISSETKIKDLNQEELQRLLIGIEKLCGYTSTNNEIFSLLPKIIAKIENPTGDTYLIGNNAVLSKKEAIEWVQSHRLDGVIVRERNGTIHLRSRPNHCIWDVSKNKFTLLPSTKEINTLARVVGEHRPGQCIWSFINGIDNTKEEALASTELISKATNGERVLCMPNDTIWAPIDLIHCLVLKTSSNTPIIPWTVKFLQHLLRVASEEKESPPVILFLHSQGAILVEHALKSLSLEEKKQLRIFTFGGGSFLPPDESHADSHNYASAADFVCRFGSPHLQLLALKRYYGYRKGLIDDQIIDELAMEDAMLHTDSINPQVIKAYAKQRIKYYENEFSKISNLTILDPDSGSKWKHTFISTCYQDMIQKIIRKYQKNLNDSCNQTILDHQHQEIRL